MGHCEGVGESVWACGLCDGCGGVQGQVERHIIGGDSKCVQSAGE